MKSLKLTAIILCLGLLGFLPKDSGPVSGQGISSVIREAVSADNEFSTVDSAAYTSDNPSPLARGEALFKTRCSGCHVTDFVLYSGMLDSEVDSVVTLMIEKDGMPMDSTRLELLKGYLLYHLPRY